MNWDGSLDLKVEIIKRLLLFAYKKQNFLNFLLISILMKNTPFTIKHKSGEMFIHIFLEDLKSLFIL